MTIPRFYYFPVLLAGITASGCHRQRAWPSNVLQVADLRIARQLITGFYGIDGNWRWTAPSFVVALNIPEAPSSASGLLNVALYFPATEVEQLGPITLTASTDGMELGKTTYSRGGSYVFVASVPALALCTNVLPVTFTLNKFIPASKADPRDLGTVVTSIRLTRST